MPRRIIGQCSQVELRKIVKLFLKKTARHDYKEGEPMSFREDNLNKKELIALQVIRSLAEKRDSKRLAAIKEVLVWEDDKGEHYLEFKKL